MKIGFAVGIRPRTSYRIRSLYFRYGTAGPTIYRRNIRHKLEQAKDINGDRYFDLIAQFARNFKALSFPNVLDWYFYGHRARRIGRTGANVGYNFVSLYTQTSMFFYQLNGKQDFVPLEGTPTRSFQSIPSSLVISTLIASPTSSTFTIAIGAGEVPHDIIVTVPERGIFILRQPNLSLDIPTGANPILGRVSVRSSRGFVACSFPEFYRPSIIQE